MKTLETALNNLSQKVSDFFRKRIFSTSLFAKSKSNKRQESPDPVWDRSSTENAAPQTLLEQKRSMVMDNLPSNKFVGLEYLSNQARQAYHEGDWHLSAALLTMLYDDLLEVRSHSIRFIVNRREEEDELLDQFRILDK